MLPEGRCVGYLEDGRVCRRPATRIDEQAGGMLCDECWRAKQRRQAAADDEEAEHEIWPGEERDEG